MVASLARPCARTATGRDHVATLEATTFSPFGVRGPSEPGTSLSLYLGGSAGATEAPRESRGQRTYPQSSVIQTTYERTASR